RRQPRQPERRGFSREPTPREKRLERRDPEGEGSRAEETAPSEKIGVVGEWVHRFKVSSRLSTSRQTVVHAACSMGSRFAVLGASPVATSFLASSLCSAKCARTFASVVWSDVSS